MLTIVIQAGGQSQRMGQDKGLVLFRGQRLVERQVQRMRSLADELLVGTNHPQDYAFLDVPLIPDPLPGRGALGGLYSSLTAASQPLVAVIACDMPFASVDLLRYQLELMQNPSYDAVVPQTGEGREPFHAIYRKATCLPLVEQALSYGKQRADSWYISANIYFLSESEIRLHDPSGFTFLNVNTPDELQKAELIKLE